MQIERRQTKGIEKDHYECSLKRKTRLPLGIVQKKYSNKQKQNHNDKKYVYSN